MLGSTDVGRRLLYPAIADLPKESLRSLSQLICQAQCDIVGLRKNRVKRDRIEKANNYLLALEEEYKKCKKQ